MTENLFYIGMETLSFMNMTKHNYYDRHNIATQRNRYLLHVSYQLPTAMYKKLLQKVSNIIKSWRADKSTDFS